MFSILQTYGPHVIQPAKGGNISVLYKKNSMYMLTENVYNIPGISIITSEYPQFITVDSGPMCRPSNWQAK